MSPLRWDVLLVGLVLAIPVLALGLRGDLSVEEMMTRVLWCLLAGWVVVGVLRFATTPRPPAPAAKAPATDGSPDAAFEPGHSPEV
jgi:hypothetical protein